MMCQEYNKHEPFFIVYDARSGSTFLSDLLIKNTNVSIPPESNFIATLLVEYPKELIENNNDFEKIIKIVYSDRKFSDWDITYSEIEFFIKNKLPLSIHDFILIVCQIYRNKNFPDSTKFGIKQKTYLTHYEKIKKVFPNSKYIGIVRDGRAVFNSKKTSIYSATGKPFETNPYKAAREWCKTLNLLKEVKKKYPNETLILSYEEMILTPQKVIKLTSEFLGLAFTENPNQNDRSYSIPERYGNLHQNVGKKPIDSRINAWQKSLSSKEIYAFESVAYKELLSLGYNVMNNKFMLFIKSNLLEKIY